MWYPDPGDTIWINCPEHDSSGATFFFEVFMELPKLCLCGNPIQFSNEDSCEMCFSLRADRLHGRSQRVKSLPWLEGENNGENQNRRHHSL